MAFFPLLDWKFQQAHNKDRVPFAQFNWVKESGQDGSEQGRGFRWSSCSTSGVAVPGSVGGFVLSVLESAWLLGVHVLLSSLRLHLEIRGLLAQDCPLDPTCLETHHRPLWMARLDAACFGNLHPGNILDVCSDVPKAEGVGFGFILFWFPYGDIYYYKGCIPERIFI